MSKLLDVASSFADAIGSAPQNCYWYGSATLQDGQIVTTQHAANPGGCTIQPAYPAAGANIGWPGNLTNDGFALIGMGADGQPLAFTDCTGFAAYVIAQTSLPDFTSFLGWYGDNRSHFEGHPQPWPSAAGFAYAGYAPIATGNWTVVVNGTQAPQEWTQLVQPGDLLAWNVTPVRGKVTDTGHILVLSSPIRTTSPTQFNVDVIDCSIVPHGDDTRRPGSSGVGRGLILLQYSGGQWRYNFGGPADCFNTPGRISVLRLNV